MRIVFYPQSCAPIHANSLAERPLGGIETGIIRLAEALHLRGHTVTVFTSEKNPPESLPQYAHLSEARHLKEIDVFICIREWIPLLGNIPAKVKLFWTGDGPEQIQNFGIGDKRIASLVDGFLAVSDWHAHVMSQESGFPIEKLTVIKNGVHIPLFEGQVEKIPGKLIYSSTPFRGLELLPEIFKRIKAEHSHATLDIYSGIDVYHSQASEAYLQQVKARFDPVFEELKNIDGVNVIGNVTQAELAKAFLSAEILCYPNTFPETSCITVMEAQTAGCVPVTSKLAALPETVAEAGVLLSETPGSPEYIDQFVASICRLLANPDELAKLSAAGRTRALAAHSWLRVAERLELYLAETFKVV